MRESSCETVDIVSIIRPMRGESQSQLVEGSDGNFYVAKFATNPRGTRTLINEWIGHSFLKLVGVSTPSICALRFGDRFGKLSPELCFRLGFQRIPVAGGLHLGSRCPVNPNEAPIFDFLPHTILPRVSNLSDFGKAFVVDKLLGKSDGRQAIFVREKADKEPPSFRGYLIDHGLIFCGKKWEFMDTASSGLYFDHGVYSMLDLEKICEQAMHLLGSLTKADLQAFADDIPQAWFLDADHAHLQVLLIKVHHRMAALPAMIARHMDAVCAAT